MTFSLHQGGVVMSSQITHTHTIINIHPLAHILDICASVFSSCAFFCSLSQPYPTLLQVITTRAREGGPKEHRAKQKWPRETHSVTYAHGPPLFPIFRALTLSLHRNSSVAERPPSHHPSSLTSVSLVPVLHLLPP